LTFFKLKVCTILQKLEIYYVYFILSESGRRMEPQSEERGRRFYKERPNQQLPKSMEAEILAEVLLTPEIALRQILTPKTHLKIEGRNLGVVAKTSIQISGDE